MKLEVGMYARTESGLISRINKITNENIFFDSPIYTKNSYGKFNTKYLKKEKAEIYIKKTSHNIIDLIEVGDYVNGYKVSFKDNDYKPFVQCDYRVQEGTTNHYRFYEEAIYSIVTKEQFESMSYKVGD